MKKKFFLLVILIAGLFLTSSLHPVTPKKQAAISHEATSTAQLSTAADADVLVTRVIDGDTIEIEGGKKVRYIGVNTPETVDPRKPVECFGKEASEENARLVGGKRVRLKKDVSQTDKYGRLLRFVYVGDLMINDYLVRQGFAYADTVPPDVAYASEFRKAQQDARAHTRGLWAGCPAGGAPPSAAKSTTVASPSGACLIKGNISADGEKIYHLPGCGSYDKTVVNETAGERWFCSESEAVAQGWRKAKNCP